MCLLRGLRISGLSVLLFSSKLVGAEEQHAVVWYRASEECPSGAEFLARLRPGAPVLLAEAGDHIDFVVTLVAARGHTVGRLERQTHEGTVAMRELSDTNCAKVADALALSLGLALEPQSLAAPAPEASATSVATTTPAPTQAGSTPAPESPAAPTASPPVFKLEPTLRATPEGPTAPKSNELRWSSSLAATVLWGIAPSPLFGGSGSLELEHALPSFAPQLALRLAVLGATGSNDTAIGSVRQWLASSHVAACPWRWGGARAFVRPCVDFELGALGASGTRASGESSVALWAVPGLSLRPHVRLADKFGLEVEAVALFPLARTEVDASDTRLYRTDIAAISAGLGIFFGPF